MADFKQITVGGTSYPAKDEVARQGLAGKQDKIDSSHKLSADLISDGSTNKTVTQTEKSSWNGKQAAISAQNKLSADLVSDGTTNKSYTATEKTKLAGIAAGAEVNVQADWNESNSSSDAYIQNKPTHYTETAQGVAKISTDNAMVQLEPNDGGTVTVKSGLFAVKDNSNTLILSSGIRASGKVYYYDSEIATKTDVSGKQDVINSSYKLSADLVDDTSATNKFVTAADKTAWNGKQDAISDLATIRSGASAGSTAYQKPQSGVPSTDMTSTVQTSLGKADTAYQKPNGGIPLTDLASAVQTSLGKADAAAPQATTYTKTEVNNLLNPIGAEIDWVTALPASGTANTIYCVQGSTSFSAYGWDGTQFVKMAEYGWIVDDVPTDGSDNLVKSGGVYSNINQLNTKVDNVKRDTQHEFLGVTEYQAGTTAAVWKTFATGVSFKQGKTYKLKVKVTGNTGTVYVAFATTASSDSGPLSLSVSSSAAGIWMEKQISAAQDYTNLYLNTYGAYTAIDIIFETIGEASVQDGDLELVLVSKNIANPADIQDGHYVTSSSLAGLNTDWSMIGVPVVAGKKYTFGGFKLGRSGYYGFYNGDTKISISLFDDPNGTEHPVTVTAPENANILYIDIKTGSSPSNPYQYLMVNEGEQLLPFEEYTKAVKKIKNHPLWGVSDDIGSMSIVADLPISDGQNIEEGFAFIDSTTHTIKVKIS